MFPAAIEELLRHETPVAQIPRVVRKPVVLHGQQLRPGERVLLVLGAANTDPDEFHDPEAVMFDRSVNRHVAFGAGPHRCVGSHLARAELRIAMEEWHRRIPDYAIEDGVELAVTPVIREIPYLPLRIPSPT
jgi:cytochrome P450